MKLFLRDSSRAIKQSDIVYNFLIKIQKVCINSGARTKIVATNLIVFSGSKMVVEIFMSGENKEREREREIVLAKRIEGNENL